MAPKPNDEPFDDANKPVGPGMGRANQGGVAGDPNQANGEAYVEHRSRQGTVVIRATVEQIGLAGDAEMTVTVKWPASTFCVQQYAQPPAQAKPVAPAANVPPNGPAAKNFDPGPLLGEFEPEVNPVQADSDGAERNQVEKAEKEKHTEQSKGANYDERDEKSR